MIKINITLDQKGILKTCLASGHANAGKIGNDIVCAAVTVLMRTATNILSNQEGITIKSSAPKKGKLGFNVEYSTAEGLVFLYHTSIFLIDGLKSVAQEFPKNCNLIIQRLK